MKITPYLTISDFQDKLLGRLVSLPRDNLVKFGKALFIPNVDSMEKVVIAKKIAYSDLFKQVENEDHFYWVDGMDFTFKTHGTFFPHVRFVFSMKTPIFKNREEMESFIEKLFAGIHSQGLLKRIRFYNFDAYGTRDGEMNQEGVAEYYFTGDDGFDNILYVYIDHIKNNVEIYAHLFRLSMDTRPLKNTNPYDDYTDSNYGKTSILQDIGDYIDFFYRLSICIRYFNSEIKKIDKAALKEYFKKA